MRMPGELGSPLQLQHSVVVDPKEASSVDMYALYTSIGWRHLCLQACLLHEA